MTETPRSPASEPSNPVSPAAPPDADALRALVRERYGAIAEQNSGCCSSGCCAPGTTAAAQSERIGYDRESLQSVPKEADLGLGCGNPTAVADLRPGEVVVDLGAGAGLDVLLAAQKVGETGRVIGVDMTPAMLARARENAVRAGVAGTVEFREGVIERLPVVDASADVVISNCAINLSPDKAAVFREAFRVLKPGGRLSVSDIVLSEPLPDDLRNLADAYVGCISGAMLARDYLAAIEAAGFTDLDVERTAAGPLLAPFIDDPTYAAAVATVGRERIDRAVGAVWSYRIRARKP